MSIEIKVPGFPESVADGTILRWNVQPGDSVRRDDSIVDIETDKVVFEVPAQYDGVLDEIIESEGAIVLAEQVIGRMTKGAVAASTSASESANETRIESTNKPESEEAPVFATPSARKLIEENNLQPESVQASGSGNRILKEDVLKEIHQHTNASPAPVVMATDIATENRAEKRVPMTRLRARIAERLLEAQQNAAILSTFNEINMQPVMELRSKYRDRFEQQHGVKLGFMSFFVKAVIEGLRQFPEINASVDGEDIIYHGYFDIGVAVSSPRGLVVPVLRDVDQRSMAEIESLIAAAASKAKDGTLSMEDITGGTFTVTNGGVFGSLLSTPIINPPQSGILGMHKIMDRPIAENGQVVIRPMMYIALSYDHRLVDGKEAVQFLVTVKEALEDPSRLLLGV